MKRWVVTVEVIVSEDTAYDAEKIIDNAFEDVGSIMTWNIWSPYEDKHQSV